MASESSTQIGYLELLRTNPDLRRIWIASVASHLGDWFNIIAIYTLVERLTGSPLALGWVLITKTLAFAVASPFAGLVADRFNRRRLMLAADLVRAVVVLGFLFVDQPGDVPLIYALAAVQMIVGAVFLPAQTAAIPNVTHQRELLTANALLSVTWSTLLAVGAGLGGLATAWLGVRAIFVIDSASYLISALFIYRAAIPQKTNAVVGSVARDSLRGILSGWRYLLAHPHVGRIALVKATWAFAGASLVYMLVLLGTPISPQAPSAGIGLLYAARGIGTGIGPMLARAWVPKRELWPAGFGLAICFSGLAYLSVGFVSWSLWILLLVFAAHAASGANWVLSTVLLQERAPDRYRGRVFSTEWLVMTVIDASMILAASLLLEWEILSLRSAIQVFAAVQVLCGVLWLLLAVPRERAWQRSRGQGGASPASE